MSESYLGLRLRYLRKQDNMTQAELGDHLGVGKSTVSMWESGQRVPDWETLESIADYFNVPMASFFASNEAPGGGLSDFERAVLKQLRLLSEDQQQKFLALLTSLISTQEP